MFMGEFNHTVDTKGRLIIPAKFREQLGENFVITKGLDRCLYIYDSDSWSKLQEKLSLMPMLNAAARNIRRMIVGSAMELETDKQGRILLPSALRTFANIEKDAVVVGNIEHIEVWSKSDWDSASDIDSDAAAEELYNSGINI